MKYQNRLTYFLQTLFLCGLLLLGGCSDNTSPTSPVIDPQDNSWYNTAKKHILAGNQDKALILLDSVYELPETFGDPTSIGRINYLKGFIHRKNGDDLQALSYYYYAIEVLEQSNEPPRHLMGRVFNRIGKVYESNQDLKKAVENYLKSYNLMKSQKDGLFNVLTDIGLAYKSLEKYDSALSYLQSALELEEVKNDLSRQGDLMNNIGESYRLKGEFDQAEKSFKQSLNHYKKTNNEIPSSLTLNNLALVYVETKQWDLAFTYLKKSVDIKEKHQTKSLFSGYVNLAELYLEKDDIRNAKHYLDKAFELDTDDLNNRSYAYNLKHKIAEAEGDVEKALIYDGLRDALRDSIHKQQLALNDMELKTRLSLDELEDKLYVSRVEYKNAINRKNDVIRWIIGISIGITIVLAAFVLMYLRINKMNAALNAITEDVSHTMRNQMQGIKGGIYSLKNFSKELSPRSVEMVNTIESSATAMEKLQTRFLEAKDKTKLVATLHNPEYTIDQLLLIYKPASIEKNIKLEKDIKDDPMVMVLPDPLEHAMGNLVSNAIKYGPENSTVTIRLDEKDGKAILSVMDEGPGIPVSLRSQLYKKRVKLHRKKGIVSSGVGLYYAKKSIESMGGKLWYEDRTDRPEGGASFNISFDRAM